MEKTKPDYQEATQRVPSNLDIRGYKGPDLLRLTPLFRDRMLKSVALAQESRIITLMTFKGKYPVDGLLYPDIFAFDGRLPFAVFHRENENLYYTRILRRGLPSLAEQYMLQIAKELGVDNCDTEIKDFVWPDRLVNSLSKDNLDLIPKGPFYGGDIIKQENSSTHILFSGS